MQENNIAVTKLIFNAWLLPIVSIGPYGQRKEVESHRFSQLFGIVEVPYLIKVNAPSCFYQKLFSWPGRRRAYMYFIKVDYNFLYYYY